MPAAKVVPIVCVVILMVNMELHLKVIAPMIVLVTPTLNVEEVGGIQSGAPAKVITRSISKSTQMSTCEFTC